MDKRRYQIFISSTYEDLKAERSQVIDAVLRLQHTPTMMEIFPSTSIPQFDYIKRLILQSDYYIVIVGCRYGSLHRERLSYTEEEFNFALEHNIPVIGFVHTGTSSEDQIELDPDKKSKLEAFRARVREGRIASEFVSPGDLAAKVLHSLQAAIDTEPRIGWVRADTLVDANEEIKRLKGEIEVLKGKLAKSGNAESSLVRIKRGYQPPDILGKEICFVSSYNQSDTGFGSSVQRVAFKRIFMELAPLLLTTPTEEQFFRSVNKLVDKYVKTGNQHNGYLQIIVAHLTENGLAERIRSNGEYFFRITAEGHDRFSSLC